MTMDRSIRNNQLHELMDNKITIVAHQIGSMRNCLNRRADIIQGAMEALFDDSRLEIAIQNTKGRNPKQTRQKRQTLYHLRNVPATLSKDEKACWDLANWLVEIAIGPRSFKTKGFSGDLTSDANVISQDQSPAELDSLAISLERSCSTDANALSLLIEKDILEENSQKLIRLRSNPMTEKHLVRIIAYETERSSHDVEAGETMAQGLAEAAHQPKSEIDAERNRQRMMTPVAQRQAKKRSADFLRKISQAAALFIFGVSAFGGYYSSGSVQSQHLGDQTKNHTIRILSDQSRMLLASDQTRISTSDQAAITKTAHSTETILSSDQTLAGPRFDQTRGVILSDQTSRTILSDQS